MASGGQEVLGFQFEPKRRNEPSCEVLFNYEYSSEEDEDITTITEQLRSNLKVSEWCTCNQCTIMTKEVEHVCCHELDSADYFELGTGKNG